MPAFSRTVLPASVSPLQLPAAIRSPGGTGKIQARTPLTIGYAWEEIYPALPVNDDTVQAWLAQLDDFWRNGIKFTLQHLYHQTQRGAGGGAPLVNGASQTGSSINTDGWPNSTTVLKAGDPVRLGALPFVQRVKANALTNGSGQVALSVEPAIVSGQSPADNAAVTYGANLTFQCILASFDPGDAGPDQFIQGLRLGFQETP